MAMESPDLEIINESITRDTYINRRATFLDKFYSPVAALALADQIFKNVTELLTFQQIRDREAAVQNITASTALDFSGIKGRLNPGHANTVLYSRSDWDRARSHSILREKNSLQVAKDASAVFHINTQLPALEILRREIAVHVTPLLPLPTTKNMQTVDDSQGTGERVNPSALQGLDLDPEQIRHILRIEIPTANDSLVNNFLDPPSAATSTTAQEASPALTEIAYSSTAAPQKSNTKAPKQAHKMGHVGPTQAGGASPATAASLSAFQQHRQIKKYMRDIVTGRALPTTIEEADEAATLRRECLLRKLESETRPISSNRVRETMALPPEFGPTNRKDIAKTRAEGLCLCTCEDHRNIDNYDWTQCDDCDVWQHTECIGKGVSRDPKDGYRCQQCDPWGQREIIKVLRSKQALAEEHFPTGR